MITPIDRLAQKPRRVPYHLIEPLQNRIEEFVKSDIMEKVPDHEAIIWCSPIVEPKLKNPKDIRVSLDLRLLNKSMLPTRNVQAPITKYFVTEFRDCKAFSKLDLNHGYYQFCLEPESRKTMTFSTLGGNYRYYQFCLEPESRKTMTFSTLGGNYRYKRLAFGRVNTQDLFDAEIAKIISGIPKVLNNRDDIIVNGRDLDEHNKNLAQLLQRLEDHNLTLRHEKCEIMEKVPDHEAITWCSKIVVQPKSKNPKDISPQYSTLTLPRLPRASKMIQWASKITVKNAQSRKQMFCSCPECVQQEIKRIENSLLSIYLFC